MPQETLVSRTYAELLEAIVALRLRPGELVSERQLEARLRASRTPIRSALNRLEAEGLVRRQRGGYLIAPLSIKEMTDAYNLRLLIEVDSVRRLTRRGPTPLERAEVEALLQRIEEDPRTEEKLNVTRDFHLRLARLSGNQLYPPVLAGLLQRIYRARYLEAIAPKSFRNEHRTIWAHICDGDEERSVEVLERHITRSRERAEAWIRRYLSSAEAGVVMG